jgi:formate dehydrogenase maturation protein FdhE
MSARDATELARVPAAPPCPICQSQASVRPMMRQLVADGVQYWACDACLVAWTARDDEALRSITDDSGAR